MRAEASETWRGMARGVVLLTTVLLVATWPARAEDGSVAAADAAPAKEESWTEEKWATMTQGYSDWVNGIEGLEMGKVELQQSGLGQHKVAAKTSIGAGQVVVKIPANHVVSISNINAHARLKKAISKLHASISPAVALSLLLIYEQEVIGSASTISRWYSAAPLPTASVIFWSVEEMHLLNGTSLQREAADRLRQISEQWTNLREQLCTGEDPVFPSSAFTFERFSLAVAFVFGKSVIVRDSNGALQPVLAPLVTSMGSAVTNRSSVSVNSDGSLSVITNEDVEEGGAIQIFVGQKSSLETMLDHGTMVLSNNYDGVPLSISVSDEAPLAAMKKKMIRQLQAPADGKFWIRIADKGAPPRILLQSLRVHLLNHRDMDLFNRIYNSTEPVSLYNELSMLRTLLSICEKLLRRFPTTIAEDDQILEESGLGKSVDPANYPPLNRRIISVLIRLREKETLLRLRMWVEAYWSSLLRKADLSSLRESWV